MNSFVSYPSFISLVLFICYILYFLIILKIKSRKADPAFMQGVWTLFCVVLCISIITILIETRSFLELNGTKITERYDTLLDFNALFVDTIILAFIVAIHLYTSSMTSTPSSRCVYVITNIVALKIAITYWSQTSNFTLLHIDHWLLDFLFYIIRLIGWFLIAIQVCSRFDILKIENLPGTPTRAGSAKPVYYRNSTLIGILFVILPVTLLTLDRFLMNTCITYYVIISKHITTQEREYFHDLFAKSWIAY